MPSRLRSGRLRPKRPTRLRPEPHPLANPPQRHRPRLERARRARVRRRLPLLRAGTRSRRGRRRRSGRAVERERRGVRIAPLRTCVGCRKVAVQDELLRVVVVESGEIRIGRHLPGRGAWICRGSEQCVDQALRKGGFARALRTRLDGGEGDRLRTDLLRYANDLP